MKSKSETMEEFAFREGVKEFKGSLEQYGVENFIAGYNAKSEEYAQQQLAPRWVKASERLPGWHKEATWRHPSAEIVNEKMWTSVAMELCSHLITDLEWLDEQPAAERAAQKDVATDDDKKFSLKEMFDFAEWIGEETNPFIMEKGRWIQSCGNSTSWTTEQLYELYTKPPKQ